MISAGSQEFLWDLLAAFGPSGFEDDASAEWESWARRNGLDVFRDVAGNTYAIKNPQGSPSIMLVGHLDQIGFMVTYINSDGFLAFSTIGGFDPAVFVGQSVYIGDVPGVVVRHATHMMTYAQQDAPIRVSDLWIDIGAKDKEEAAKLVKVGSPGIIDSPSFEMPNDRICAPALDNRIGSFAVLEAAIAYEGSARVVAVGAVHEETLTPHGGAGVAARNELPDYAIVVDVTHATDYPDTNKKKYGDRSLGSGPAVAIGGVVNRKIAEQLIQIAEEKEIPHTVEASPGRSGTDTDSIFASTGVPTGILSLPLRYMHTPVEIVNKNDVENTIKLMVGFCGAHG